MKTFSSAVLLLLMALTSFGQSPEGANTYSNALFGVTLTKPGKWFFGSAERSPGDPKKTALTDEEFRTLLKKYSTASLVLITKYQEPFDDLNPNLTLKLIPSEDASIERSKALLGAIAEGARRKNEKFRMIVPAKETTLQGYNATYSKIHYSFKGPNGKLVPEAIEIWAFPRENHFLLLGLSMRQDEMTGKREEFDGILKSLRLEPVSAIVPKGKSSNSQADKPFLNEKKQVPGGMEWNREIVTKRGGEIRYVVSSPEPFGVTLITDKAKNDMKNGVKRKFGNEDVLVTFDCKEQMCDKTISLDPGSYHFIIENQSDKEVELKLECYGLKK